MFHQSLAAPAAGLWCLWWKINSRIWTAHRRKRINKQIAPGLRRTDEISFWPAKSNTKDCLNKLRLSGRFFPAQKINCVFQTLRFPVSVLNENRKGKGVTANVLPPPPDNLWPPGARGGPSVRERAGTESWPWLVATWTPAVGLTGGHAGYPITDNSRTTETRNSGHQPEHAAAATNAPFSL